MTVRATRSNDPIPSKAIRISDAFERVFQALRSNPQPIETLDVGLRKYLINNRNTEDGRDSRKFLSAENEDAIHFTKQAVVFFRTSLRNGELTAYIRDPDDGTILQLDGADWSPTGGRLMLLEPPYAFEDDYLENTAFSGNPNTLIRGACRPVFLLKQDFEQWLTERFGKSEKQAGGRPKGSGSWAEADRELLVEMKRLIDTHEAKSPNDAARIVASNAKGNSSLESKQWRLAKRYRQEYPPERN